MTEDEAREKWCNERAKVAALLGYDPYGRDANCIASDCVRWQWKYKKADNRELYKDYSGYCGLIRR